MLNTDRCVVRRVCFFMIICRLLSIEVFLMMLVPIPIKVVLVSGCFLGYLAHNANYRVGPKW
jgi:hypothetical protein